MHLRRSRASSRRPQLRPRRGALRRVGPERRRPRRPARLRRRPAGRGRARCALPGVPGRRDIAFSGAIDHLVGEGCTTIVAAGDRALDAMVASATAHPGISYVWVDESGAQDTTGFPSIAGVGNLTPILFDLTQPAFIAGYLAAGMTKSGIVGVFAESGDAVSLAIMDAFTQGVSTTTRSTPPSSPSPYRSSGGTGRRRRATSCSVPVQSARSRTWFRRSCRTARTSSSRCGCPPAARRVSTSRSPPRSRRRRRASRSSVSARTRSRRPRTCPADSSPRSSRPPTSASTGRCWRQQAGRPHPPPSSAASATGAWTSRPTRLGRPCAGEPRRGDQAAGDLRHRRLGRHRREPSSLRTLLRSRRRAPIGSREGVGEARDEVERGDP